MLVGTNKPVIPTRRFSTSVKVGDKVLGGTHPVLVQSMTNTPTEDVGATVCQIQELAKAGSEIVRITVNTAQAANSVAKIVCDLEKLGICVPLVGDFHYNGHLLLTQYPDCAKLLAKYRINPGNLGHGKKHDQNFQSMIEVAVQNNKPVRIGVNWGSLDQELLSRLMDDNSMRTRPLNGHKIILKAMVESALQSAQAAESYGLPHEHIVLSAKVSDVPDLIEVYRQLAQSCDYALHVGLTEAGMSCQGIVASTAALAVLLLEGIGDTIRVSLTPEPGQSRAQEVLVCQQILQTLGLRSFMPQVTSCPGCGRTASSFFQELAKQVQDYVASHRQQWQAKFPGVQDLRIAVMGCIVNGPGESRHANIGISLPGTSEEPHAPVYMDGEHVATLSGPDIADEFIKLLEQYIERNYS